MHKTTRRVFIGGAAAFAIMSGRLGFAAVPQRRQRRFFDTTWWDPFVEDIADAAGLTVKTVQKLAEKKAA